ncbi:alkyl/aryl-sulfatase [Schlesneria paludicola]|uniref:alkyl/aryl-sulfatase n=1 Tax=Schlesneria paludicola TaxID=360056 RepID=UPI00029AA603|nr:alkyl sulfatase dimerization domain-containing protein [Schlesneria paludicola]
MIVQRHAAWLFLLIGIAVGRVTLGPTEHRDTGAEDRLTSPAITFPTSPISACEPPTHQLFKSPKVDHTVLQTVTAATSIARARGPKGATAATRQAQQKLAERLDFSDKQDFEDARRGFIAPLPNDGIVHDGQGRIIWNLNERSIASPEQSSPDTVNPSLWRQAQLLGIGGLFKVSERIFQVRGLDLANITFIEGETGLIVIDPLLSSETAKAALDLYYAHRPHLPVISVIITHCHPDHFGGLSGVVSDEELAAGKVSIIAPKFFLDEVISENVLAGNAMQRRAGYMYGSLLPKGPQGDVGNGLGLGTSAGTTTLIKPTDSISHTGELRVIDGLTFEFQLTPGSEAPAEMHLYIHELKGLCPAENATHTMHNLYTLRGAKIRDARAWASYLQQTIDLFGHRTDVLFAPHHWPVWDQEQIVNHLSSQRDLYKFIHDQTLRLANSGHNMLECAEQIQLPPEIERHWANRGYYGSLNHNVKAVWNFYLGWFDGHPARLHPLPPKEAGANYLDYMGGIDQVVAKARESFNRGEYRWVAQVLDHAVSAEPEHLPARELLADALEQLGYQAESGPWRNFYLTGAQELREGIRVPETTTTASTQSIAALPLEAIFDSLAVRLDSGLAADSNLAINFKFTDTDEQYLLTLQHGVLNHFAGRQHPSADCTVRVTRPAFDEILDGRSSFARQVFSGEARINGKPRKLMEFFQPIEQFEPWFDVMRPHIVVNSAELAQQEAL